MDMLSKGMDLTVYQNKGHALSSSRILSIAYMLSPKGIRQVSAGTKGIKYFSFPIPMMLINSPVINSVLSPPRDTPSSLDFNPVFDVLGVSAWDGTMRFYSTTTMNEELVLNEEKPVLSTSFSEDGHVAFAGISDGNILVYHLKENKSFKISAHGNAVKSLKFYKNLVISGSFDKTLKFWDLRSPNPVHTINLPERVFCMDLKKDMLALSTAGNRVSVYNLKDNCSEKKMTTKLFWQIRSICCGNDNDTVIVGGIEGKAEILTISPSAKRMVFRCHRTKDDLYAVNTISMHPGKPNVVVSGGSDGVLSFFDRDSRLRLFNENLGSPVTCSAFNPSGTLFACGIGYDWSRGYDPGAYNVDVKIAKVSSLKI